MPELPEVETIRLGLQKYLVGHRINDIKINFHPIFIGDKKIVIGSTITKIRRFGKGLVIDLGNGQSLAIHVKMTGQLIYRPSSKDYFANKHTHVIFFLDKNAILLYNDIRKFGWIRVVKTDEVKELPFFKNLGLEPLKDLSLETFKKIISGSKLPVKVLLMDQSKIAGVGNIYANDALFKAGINPGRRASSLTDNEIKRLYEAVESVLKKGIVMGGASERNYINALGEKGSYQEHFLVYKRNGKPCFNCGTKIEKIKLGGRGTFYCPKCQREY